MDEGQKPSLKVVARREWKTLVRFCFVGGSSFAVKATAYTLMSRVFWNSGPRAVQNMIALVLAMAYNYLFHRFWTFKANGPAAGSGPRYIAVVIVASLMDGGLFYIGHNLLGYYDLFVLVATGAFIALFTFTAHRLFTFNSNPYKKKANVVQSG